MIQLWRDPRTGEYGLKQFRLPDGSYTYVVPLGDDREAGADRRARHQGDAARRRRHRRHGGAAGGRADPFALVRPLPQRALLRLPERGRLSARGRAGSTTRRQGPQRPPRGARACATSSTSTPTTDGVVELTDCHVHWWILDDSDKRRKTSELPNNGHFGALYQGEIYEMITGRGGTARLQQFGVLFGTDRVVLYVEPRNGAGRTLSANTARTQLLLNGAAAALRGVGARVPRRTCRRRSATTWTP